MFRKIIFLLVISSIAISGFAQKSKRKTNTQSPRFELYINNEREPAASYCPNDSISFNFYNLDPNLPDSVITWRWWDSYYILHSTLDNVKPIKLAWPVESGVIYPQVSQYTVSVFIEIRIGGDVIYDTLTTKINIDYYRTILKAEVCQGRDITISTSQGERTFTDVQGDIITPWDTLQTASCDSLVRWEIKVNPYNFETYEIKSCGDVKWGEHIIKRPEGHQGDYTEEVERVFPARNPDLTCDTLKTLKITIIDKPELLMNFDQEVFCKGEDMLGVLELTTNFTAFDWTYDKLDNGKIDTAFTIIETPNLEIIRSGRYRVVAYMDTSLYKILHDLRITNCSLTADTLAADCKLIIPNIITPGGNQMNDYFAIRKLNLDRENELTIYDRWGKNVFRKKNYRAIFKHGEYFNLDEDTFKGLTRGGQKLPDGAYYYSFVYDALPKKIVYSGTIVIIKDGAE